MCKKKDVVVTVDDKVVIIENLPFNMSRNEVLNVVSYELNIDSSKEYDYQSLKKFISKESNLNFYDKMVVRIDYLKKLEYLNHKIAI